MDRDKAIRAAKLTIGGMSSKDNSFETSTQDASHIFGDGSVYKFYKHPESGGYIQVLQKKSGPASVIGLEVPEEFRGKGIGQALQAEAMKNHPSLMGQVSSKAAATTAYRLGRRPYGNPSASLDDVYKGIDENSSINLMTPDAQPKSKGGALELARHATAVGRAGGQVAPSKYMPNVPRAVHADGGPVLPKGYSLKVDREKMGVLAHYNGQPVGQLTLMRDRDSGDLTAFQMAVHPKHQRKGLMSAMHDAAEDAFGPMQPDKTLTDDGFAFWKGYRPDAVSNNLRFHADKLMGQTMQTRYGPGTVKSVGSNGMNTDLTDPERVGSTGWASVKDNEDAIRGLGIDPSTLKYADGGEVESKRDFVRDNPGGEWLEGKKARAAQYPDDKFMVGATTGVIGGRSSMFLPTHILKGIAGLNDEVRTSGVHKYDSLLSDAREGGFDPDQKGNKVVVAVNHYGQPYLLEGNTRVAVAHSMGIPKVRAEVRYWNGAENVDGPMHPENVFNMASDSPDVSKADGGEVDGDGEFEVGKKYSGVIPQIKYLPVHAIERQPSQYEVSHVSDDVAKNMDFSEPVEATAFRYSSNNREDHPSVALQNGHHRLAAARQTGRPHLPVTLTAVNAKGEKLNALKALSDEIERGMISKATGGPVMGYVPMASLTVPRLAVARAPQYQQQQGGAGKFSDSLNSLMKTVEGFKKKPEADAAVESPSAASEGRTQLGMIAMPEEGYEATGMYAPFQSAIDRMIADAPGKITVASGYRTPEEQEALWNQHAAKYPDPEVRDDYVARPGQSSHNYGLAADLSYADQEAIKWAQENAPKYGLNFRMGHENWHIEPSNIWELRNAMTVPGYATGGRTLDKSGLYSKALEVARNIQQQRGTPAQFMAQLKNSKGVKPAEIEAIGMPSGDKMTRDEFVQHIASKVPKLSTAQYGENPDYLSRNEQKLLRDTWMKEDLSPEDQETIKNLRNRRDARPFQERNYLGNDIEPGYEEYTTEGGDNYRERLIKLGGENQYQSSHWNEIPNVLAHIRMKDRNSPDGKKLLHVEEIQSDWGQQGREKGFHDPQNPYEVYREGTNEVVSRHPDYNSMWDAYRTHPESNSMNYGDARERKIPAAPYVQNTQHWTDLAMKHIMREAALGNYDGVVFTPGQVHADRYGMEDASGMKGYYDNIVPKSALSTVQQHDPSIKPQTMNVNGEYDAMHIPLTSTAKDSILKNGFSMFKRGGTVDVALALTRGFTKDGKSAISALKTKGK